MDGSQLAEAIRGVTGNPGLPVKPFPRWMMRLASPFVPLFRELLEIALSVAPSFYLGN